MTTDDLARAFAAAGAALGVALTEQLQATDPELAAKLTYAVQQGERMGLCMEFDPIEPCIRLITIDDYQNVKRVMHIRGATPPTKALQ